MLIRYEQRELLKLSRMRMTFEKGAAMSLREHLDKFQIDVKNPKSWHLTISLSDVPMENWMFHRNKLKDENLLLFLELRSIESWKVQLERHDRSYVAQWREDSRFDVEASLMKYRRLVEWPPLTSLEKFPDLVSEIETALDVQFLKVAQVRHSNLSPGQSLDDGSVFRKWLSNCADEIDWESY